MQFLELSLKSHTLTSLSPLHMLTRYLCCPPPTHTHTTSQLILSRKSEILSVDCEMSAVHGLLSKLPESLNYEQLIRVAGVLFERHPPRKVAKKGRLKMSNRSVRIPLFLLSLLKTYLIYLYKHNHIMSHQNLMLSYYCAVFSFAAP